MSAADEFQPVERQTEVTAAAAFRRFAELTATPEGLLQTPRDQYLDFVQPFLADPRFLPHVEMIMDAIAQQQWLRLLSETPLKSMTHLPGFRGTYNRGMSRAWARWNERAAEQMKELLANVSPGDVVLDLLPPLLVETRAEYAARGERLYLLQGRIAVSPSEGVVPARVEIRMSVLGDTPHVQMMAASPESEVADMGTMTAGGEVTRETSDASKVTGGLEVKAVKIGVESGTSEVAGEKRTVTVAGKRTAQRIVSWAIKREARWTMLRTEDYAPVGGLDFNATILVAEEARELKVGLTATVEFEEWGEVRSELPAISVALPRPGLKREGEAHR